MASHDYCFVSTWRCAANIEEVSDILADAEGLARWWSKVYLQVRVTEPGRPDGIGRKVGLLTKGWLPYKLQWSFVVTESNPPHGFSIAAHGDFEGTGVWTLRQDGDFADIRFDWTIRAEKPLLKTFSFVLKPLFAWNHRWAMAEGERALIAEIARRRALQPSGQELVARR